MQREISTFIIFDFLPKYLTKNESGLDILRFKTFNILNVLAIIGKNPELIFINDRSF